MHKCVHSDLMAVSICDAIANCHEPSKYSAQDGKLGVILDTAKLFCTVRSFELMEKVALHHHTLLLYHINHLRPNSCSSR